MRNKIDKFGVQVVWSFSRSRQFVAEIRQSCPRPPSPANNAKLTLVNTLTAKDTLDTVFYLNIS